MCPLIKCARQARELERARGTIFRSYQSDNRQTCSLPRTHLLRHYRSRSARAPTHPPLPPPAFLLSAKIETAEGLLKIQWEKTASRKSRGNVGSLRAIVFCEIPRMYPRDRPSDYSLCNVRHELSIL